MTKGLQQQSAEIIPFPARGRFAVATPGEASRPAATLMRVPTTPAAGKVAVSSGWYHDAAIQDERARRR